MPSKRKLSLNAEEVATTQPGEITAEQLHALLDQGEAAVAVVDVRPAEQYAARHIAGSVNRPIHEINFATMVEECRTLEATFPNRPLVFVSAQSPDIDDLAAREFMNEYTKTLGRPPASNRVLVLLGGLYTWNTLYP